MCELSAPTGSASTGCPARVAHFNRKLKTCVTVSKLTRHQCSSTHDLPLTLHTAGVIAGAFLVVVGVLGLMKPDFAQVVKQFPRSRVAGVVLLTICLAWTFGWSPPSRWANSPASVVPS
jgi:hypothetical protein